MAAITATFNKQEEYKMKFLKINCTEADKLYYKIIAMTDNFPDRTYITKGSNPSLWTFLDPVLINKGSYEMFKNLFAEERKLWVDGDIDIFNDKLVSNEFQTVELIKTFKVNNTRFLILEKCDEMCFVLMEGNRALQDRPEISGGKDGFFWTKDFYEKRIRKSEFRKVFGLTEAEADEFMKKYRS
jgi:hypothetical protein